MRVVLAAHGQLLTQSTQLLRCLLPCTNSFPAVASQQRSCGSSSELTGACRHSVSACNLAALSARGSLQPCSTWTTHSLTTSPACSSRSMPMLQQTTSQRLGNALQQGRHGLSAVMQAAGLSRPSTWVHMQSIQMQHVRHMSKPGALSRVRVPKSAAINDTVMPNTTTLKHGLYGIRALTGKRVAANTIEAVRRTLRRRLKKTAALWVRIQATVPVTRKPQGIRMGKGKGAIEFYACAVRPGQIIFEMDRVPRKVAMSALEAIQPKFPCRLAFVEWN